MNCYRIEFDRRVKKDLTSVPAQDMIRIKAAISDLAENPRPSEYKKLKGKKREYSSQVNPVQLMSKELVVTRC